MTDGSAVIQSIAMLAAFALIWGGILLVRRRADRTRGVLMLVAAIVLIGNVLIWITPIRG